VLESDGQDVNLYLEQEGANIKAQFLFIVISQIVFDYFQVKQSKAALMIRSVRC